MPICGGGTMIIKRMYFGSEIQHLPAEGQRISEECSQMETRYFSGEKNNYVTIRHSGKNYFQIDEHTI
jgi:hypothetical protein